MAKKITQYPASGGNPDVGSLIDISELSGGIYTSKKLTIQQLLTYLTANLNVNQTDTFLNETGTIIPVGIPCEIYTTAVTNIPSVRPITASSSTTGLSQIYVSTEAVLNTNSGIFIKAGLIQMNTQNWVAGSKLFWNFSTSTLTNVATLEDQIFVGIVLVQGTFAGGGKIFASPTRPPQLIKGASGQIPLFMGERKINGNTHFTYIDTNGTEVGFRFSDDANNLTQVGVTYINIESEGLASNSVLRLANWANNTNKGIVSFRKSRGTRAIPTRVLANDVLGSTIFTGSSNKTVDGLPVAISGMTTGEIVVRAMVDFLKAYDSNLDSTSANGLTQFEIWLQENSGFSAGDFTPSNIKVFSVDGNGLVKFKNYTFPITDGTNGQILQTNGAGQLSWGNSASGNLNTINNSIPFFDGFTNNLISSEFVYQSSPKAIKYGDVSTNLTIGTKYYYQEYANNSTGGQQTFDNGISLTLINEAQYDCPKIELSHTRGTRANQTALLNNDSIGLIYFNPADITALMTGSIRAVATENHSIANSDFGTKLVFSTTANGDFNPQPSLTIEQDGAIYFRNYALPANNGVTGQVLVADGLGMMQWQDLDGSFIPRIQGNEVFRGVTHRNNSVTYDTYGGYTMNITGAQFAKSVIATNYQTRQVVSSYQPTATGTGSYGCLRGASALWSITGGFYFICDYGIADSGYAVGTHNFVGLTTDTTTLAIGSSLNNQPSALLNIIAMASDSGDANMQIMHNDNSGVATKIDLGSSFPSNRTAGNSITSMYQVEFYNSPASTSVKYRVTNKETGAVATGTITTNLPSTSNFLTYQVGRSMGTSAGGVNGSATYVVSRLGFYNI